MTKESHHPRTAARAESLVRVAQCRKIDVANQIGRASFWFGAFKLPSPHCCSSARGIVGTGFVSISKDGSVLCRVGNSGDQKSLQCVAEPTILTDNFKIAY